MPGRIFVGENDILKLDKPEIGFCYAYETMASTKKPTIPYYSAPGEL
jgi:hypothetical protein